MKRRKNLERAVVLGLLLSTSVYETFFAKEITNQDSDGGIYVNNSTFTESDRDENSEINGFGVRAGKDSTITLTVNNIDININDKYSSSTSGAGGISIDNKNGTGKTKVSINANGNVNLINKEPVNLKDLSGIYINSGSISTATKYGQGIFELDLNNKGSFVIDSFQNGMTLDKNSNVNIKNAIDITIKNNSNDGLKITPLMATSSDNVSGDIILFASNDINFINNKTNGIEIRQNTGNIQLNAGNNIIFDNSNKNEDNRIGTAINMYNSHLKGEAESNIIFDAGNKIEIKGFETAISNEHSDNAKFFANNIVIKDVTTGIHLNGGINKGNDYISNITLDATQKTNYENSSITINADDTGIEASGASTKDGYGNVYINSKINELMAGNLGISTTTKSFVEIKGVYNTVGAGKIANEYYGNEQAVSAKSGSKVDLLANEQNVIYGAVYSTGSQTRVNFL